MTENYNNSKILESDKKRHLTLIYRLKRSMAIEMGNHIRKKYLLTLYRQGIYKSGHNSDSRTGIGVTEGAENEIAKPDEKNIFYSTDYFDKLIIKEIGEDSDMAAFLGMDSEIEPKDDVMSMRNFAIYQDVEKEDVTSWLLAEEGDYPYLSLIFVYITPDVLARISIENLDEDYISKFEVDLQSIVDKSNCKDPMQVCVFRMMSSSDFMVIVRSKSPEGAFDISTDIRKRMIKKKNEEGYSLSVYKTYTILTIDGANLNIEQEPENSEQNNCFAIRGRYSNLYWRNIDQDILAKKPKSILHLNGRYDFLLYLSAEDFYFLSPLLLRAKGIYNGESVIGNESTATSEEAEYLQFLLQNEYLSYINERYLIKDSHLDNQKSVSYSDVLFLDEDAQNKTYMFDDINSQCTGLLNKIKKIKYEWGRIEIYNESVSHSLRLLSKLAQLCQNINGLSDARIHILALLKQLDVVIDSIQTWIEIYKRNKDKNFFDFFEIYLRQTIIVLDAYERIIYSNSFQTLQAPEYSIVTGCSTEKFIIGYRRFLDIVMNFCIKELHEGEENPFFIVMVPQLQMDSLSVEILFPKWWEEKGDDTEQIRKRKCLMAVRGPSTEKITEISSIMTLLFHELAHQLKYEDRSERNLVLLELFVSELADAIVKSMFGGLSSIWIGGDITNEVKFHFFVCIKETLQKTLFESRELAYKDYSLENFKFSLQEDFDEFLEILQDEHTNLKTRIRSFIEDTSEYIKSDSDMIEMIHRIVLGTEHLTDFNKWLEELREQAAKGGGGVDTKLLFDDDGNIKEMDKLVGTVKKDLIESVTKYIQKCAADVSDEEEESLNSMGRSIFSVIGEYRVITDQKKIDAANEFYKTLYKRLCETWQEEMADKSKTADKNWEISASLLPNKKEWLRTGRKYGIDYESDNNLKILKKQFRKALLGLRYYQYDIVMKKIGEYREITSDIFMCSMCELTICGYLTLCAKMYSNVKGRYKTGFLERFADVILIQWGMADSMEVNNISDKEICGDSMFGGVWKALSNGFQSEADRGSVKDLRKLFQEYGKCCDDADSKNVAFLSADILGIIKERVSYYKEMQFLMEDYLKGKAKYKRLQEKFASASEYPIQCVHDICMKNKEYLNNFGKPKDGSEYRKTCEDFIIKMFYYDKLYYSLKGDA